MNSARLRPDPLQWTLNFLLLVLVTGLWTLPTWINHFPLSYYDTAYYLFNAKNLTNPTLIGWRPLTYSFFIGPLFKYFGPTAIIITQNFVLASGLFYFNKSLKIKVSRLYFLLFSLILFLTPLVFTSNFIMPDAFAGLSLLFLISFLYGRKEWQWYSLFLCFLFSMMHYSNLLMVIPTLLILHPIFRNRTVWLSTLALLTLILFRMAMFYPQKNIEQTGHVLLFSRLTHYRITNDFYKLNCPQKGNLFCEDPSITFDLWGKSRSGDQNRDISKAELLPSMIMTNQAIMKSSLFPYYIYLSLKQTIEQLFEFYRPIEFVLEDKILSFYYMSYGYIGLFENQRYFNGKRINSDFFLAGLSLVFFITACLSFLSCWLMFAKHLLPHQLQGAVKVFISGYFFNSLSVGFLSEPAGRYNTRLVWVVACILFLGLIECIGRKQASKLVQKI